MPARNFWLRAALVLALVLGGLGSYLANERVHLFGGAAPATEAPQVIPAATVESGWPQFRGGAARTGYTPDPGPGGKLDLRWSFTADEVLAVLVSDRGSVYVSGRKGGIYALDAATGAQRWAVDLSPNEYSEENRYPFPAVSDGVLYTGTFDGNIVALDTADGSVIWQRAVSTAPVVASFAPVDDRLYLLTPEGTIQALDRATGTTIWEWTGAQPLSGWAAAVGGGLLYAPDVSGNLVAIDVATGETSWTAELGDARRNPAYADGTVYVGGDNQSFYALNANDGSVIWESEPFMGDQALNPIVTPKALIATWANGPMRALDRKTGAVLWEVEGPGSSASPHASVHAVYEVSRDLQDYIAYDLQTGAELGRVAAPDGAAAAITGENLFLASLADGQGIVRAFGPGSGAPIEMTAEPSTPMKVATPIPQSNAEPAASTAFDASQVNFVWSLDNLGAQPTPVIGPDGNIYIADGEQHQILVLSPDGELIEQWGEKGSGPGQFNVPQSMGFDAGGNLYVFDSGNDRVQKFAPDHTFLGEWGSSGEGNGQFHGVDGTVDPVNGLVYTVDFDNNRVQVFDLDGNFLDKWGSAGKKDGEFVHPGTIAVGPDGLVYVGDTAESNGARVQIFNQAGTFQGTLLDAGGDTAIFTEVWGMAFDSAGNIYVADYWNHSIRVFGPEGREIGTIADVEGAGPFTHPARLAIDADDNLYITDFDAGRLVKLALPTAE